jgi:hypothetical protein
MTGWLLILFVVFNSQGHRYVPVQLGPFANQTACQQAVAKIKIPESDYVQKWTCLPQGGQP